MTYKDRRGERQTFSMQEAIEIEKRFDGPRVKKKGDLHQEFMKRLKYTKEIISSLLVQNLPTQNSPIAA